MDQLEILLLFNDQVSSSHGHFISVCNNWNKLAAFQCCYIPSLILHIYLLLRLFLFVFELGIQVLYLLVHHVILCIQVCIFVSIDFCECRSSLPPPGDLRIKRGRRFCEIRERFRGFQQVCSGTTAAPCNCSSIECQVT